MFLFIFTLPRPLRLSAPATAPALTSGPGRGAGREAASLEGGEVVGGGGVVPLLTHRVLVLKLHVAVVSLAVGQMARTGQGQQVPAGENISENI